MILLIKFVVFIICPFLFLNCLIFSLFVLYPFFFKSNFVNEMPLSIKIFITDAGIFSILINPPQMFELPPNEILSCKLIFEEILY